jgi:hypothetical protein
MTIQTVGPFEQVISLKERPPIPVPFPSRGPGQLGGQGPLARAMLGEAPAVLETRSLLESRGTLAFSRSLFESTRAILVLENKAQEALGRFFVPPGERMLPPGLITKKRAHDEVHPYVVGLRNLIEHEQIAAARRMLGGLPLRFLDDPEISRLRRVLAPPAVRKTEKRDIDRRSEYDWIRSNLHAYRGQWVALDGGQLLAAAASLRELREQLKALQPTRPPLIHRIQ